MAHFGRLIRDRLHLLTPVFGGNYGAGVMKLGPLAYYPLNDAVGAVSARDWSGHGYHGTPNAVTFGAVGMGDGLTAASFNGTSSYINVFSAGLANAFTYNEGTFLGWGNTLTAWNTLPRGYVWACYDATAAKRSRLYKSESSDPGIGMEHVTGGAGTLVFRNPAGLTTNKWYCLVGTWKVSVEVNIYLNGELLTPATVCDSTTTVLKPAYMNIGAVRYDAYPVGTSWWNGRLAHCALWNRALTVGEIRMLARK